MLQRIIFLLIFSSLLGGLQAQEDDDPYNDPNLNKELNKDGPFGKDSKGKGLEEAAKLMQGALDSEGKLDASKLKEITKKLQEKGLIKKILEENAGKLRSIDDSKFKEAIYEKLPAKAQEFLDDNPKILKFWIELMKDPKALPTLIEGVTNQTKMTYYIGVLVGSFVISYIIKRRNRWKRKSLLQAIGGFILRTIIILGINFGSFYYIFNQEVQPIKAIFLRVFFP